MDPKEPLQTVLVVVYHVLVAVLFHSKLLTKCKINLVHGFVKVGKGLFERFLNRWNNLGAHCFTKLLNHKLLDGFFAELLRLVLFSQEVSIGYQSLEHGCDFLLNSWKNLRVYLRIYSFEILSQLNN